MRSVRSVIFVMVFAGVGAMPALAAPRDDAAAAIARCGAYADNRTYLDCIYGAVQPLRASLGLSSALPAQVRLVPPSGGVQAYAPQAGPQAPPPSAAPQGGAVLGQFFGGGPDLHMTAYSFDKRGFLTVTLSNGQVWRQVANDTSFAQLGAKASDYVVSLSPGQAGLAKLSVKGETGVFTVQQIR